MQILFLLFCSIFYAKSEILTYDGIYEEIKTCQAELITKQKNIFAKLKNTAVIIFGSNKTDNTVMQKLVDVIIDVLNKYNKSTKQKDFKITSNYAITDCKIIGKKSILRFFQNAYIFNKYIVSECKTNEELNIQYHFDLMETNIDVDDLKKILNKQYQEKKLKRHQLMKQMDSRFNSWYLNDIILIDNCMSTLEDYEFVFTEYMKIDNLKYDKTSLIFIILQLDKNNKKTFYDTKPWIHLSNISKNNLELSYEAYYLEKRCPFGEFEINNNEKYVLGKYISKNHSENKYVNIFFKTQIDRSVDVKHTSNSFNCICASIKKNDIFLNPLFKKPSFFIGANYALETINILIYNCLCILNIFHTKKLIEDIKEKKTKVFMITVIVYLGKLEDNQLKAEYAYFMTIVNDNISYSFFHDKLIIGDKMINQHLRAIKLVSNIKSHMNSSLMYYKINFDVLKIIYHDNIYLYHCTDFNSRTMWVIWDYQKICESIKNIINKFVNDFDLRATFILYKYQLLTDRYYKKFKKEGIDMFVHVKDLTHVEQISEKFEMKLSEERNKYCLQICLSEHGFTKFYYLFLPTYEFQLEYYDYGDFDIIMSFKKLLNTTKTKYQEELTQDLSTLYNYVIDNIKQLKNIPLLIIKEYFSKKHSYSMGIFIYIAIAVNAKYYNFFTNLFNTLTTKELLILNSLKIPRYYNFTKKSKVSLYNKLMSNMCFVGLHTLVRNSVFECFQQISKPIETEIQNRLYHMCHLQCGGKLPDPNEISKIQKMFSGKINLYN